MNSRGITESERRHLAWVKERLQDMDNDKDWKDVYGWEGLYQVNSFGEIRSVRRLKKARSGLRPYGGIQLTPAKNSSGYLYVNLTDSKRRRQYLVHRIVLEAFVGIRPEGFHCCHANGDKTDNRIENLRWDTPLENINDNKRLGVIIKGSKIWNAKLSEGDVLLIRQKGMSARQASEMFGISKSNAKKIVRGEIWSHVCVE